MNWARRRRAILCAGAALAAACATVALPAPAQQNKKAERVCPQGRVQIAKFATDKGSTLPAAIPKPLSGKDGDAERGMEVAADPGRGGCLACHHIARVLQRAEQGDAGAAERYGRHGELGAPLNGVARRFSEAELRLIVADPKKAFPGADIAMPAYHNIKDLSDVHPHCKGRPILSAQDVEDVVAFLKTLK